MSNEFWFVASDRNGSKRRVACFIPCSVKCEPSRYFGSNYGDVYDLRTLEELREDPAIRGLELRCGGCRPTVIDGRLLFATRDEAKAVLDTVQFTTHVSDPSYIERWHHFGIEP